MQEKILSALVGLAGAVQNNGKTEHTDHIVREALCFNHRHPNDFAEEAEAIVTAIHSEKHIIAPDCAACLHPCGNTSDYDLTLLHQDSSQIQALKAEMADLAGQLAEHPAADTEMLYNIIFWFGYSLSPQDYQAACEQLRHAIDAQA